MSVWCLKSRSMRLWGCKWKRLIGYCVNGSMVRKRHLGNTDEGVIRVLVIDKVAFPVTYMPCSLVEKNC